MFAQAVSMDDLKLAKLCPHLMVLHTFLKTVPGAQMLTDLLVAGKAAQTSKPTVSHFQDGLYTFPSQTAAVMKQHCLDGEPAQGELSYSH